MEALASGIILLLFGTPGVRLLTLWRRTRLAPERFLSMFFVGMAVGIPSSLYVISHRGESAAYFLRLLSIFAQLFAMGGILLFTRQVFRPNAGLAKIACAISLCVYAAGVAILIGSGQLMSQLHWSGQMITLWALGTVIWAFVECFGYYRRMRRQQRMGLGDPVVCNRFLLWSIWTGSFILLPVMSVSVRMYLIAVTPEGQQAMASPELLAFVRGMILCCGTVAAGSILLSFFPPARYITWVRARVATA